VQKHDTVFISSSRLERLFNVVANPKFILQRAEPSDDVIVVFNGNAPEADPSLSCPTGGLARKAWSKSALADDLIPFRH
jgi:hypothetical protein